MPSHAETYHVLLKTIACYPISRQNINPWRSLLAVVSIKLSISLRFSATEVHASALIAILQTFITQAHPLVNELPIVTAHSRQPVV